MKRISLLLVLTLVLGTIAMADDEGSVVTFLVLKEANGKPIRNASVILHKVDKKGRQEKAYQQIKTDPDGKAVYPGVPLGKIRVQVIASGFQTFGEDFDIKKDTAEIVVKLKRPQDQVTIYK